MSEIAVPLNGYDLIVPRKYNFKPKFGNFNDNENEEFFSEQVYIKKEDEVQQLFIGYLREDSNGFAPGSDFTQVNKNTHIRKAINANQSYFDNSQANKAIEEILVSAVGLAKDNFDKDKSEQGGATKEVVNKINGKIAKEVVVGQKVASAKVADSPNPESPVKSVSISPVIKPVQATKPVKSWASLVKGPSSPTAQPVIPGKVVPAGFVRQKSPTSPCAEPLNELSKVFNKLQLSMNSPPFHTRGLSNPSFLCYANSIIQPFLHIPLTYNLLNHLNAKLPASYFGDMPILSALLELFKESRKNGKKNKDSAIASSKIISLIKAFGTKFDTQIGIQEDSQEFLSLLLNCLDEEFVALFKKHNLTLQTQYDEKSKLITFDTVEAQVPSLANSEGSCLMEPKSAQAKLLEHKSVRSPFTAIFSGLYRSTAQQNGEPPKVNLNSSTILQIAIEDDTVTNLSQALEKYFHLEELNGSKHSTVKESFDELPPVLIVQLKLVQYSSDTGFYKLNKDLHIPLDLELNKNVLSDPNLTNKLGYQLCSVVYHHGKEALAGHYNVDVRKSDGSWVYCNDEFVEKIQPDQVGKSAHSDRGSPYILFYQRK